MRGVLHVAAAPLGQVPLCRQTQVADLQAFLGQGIQECRGGSIYVSGVPGTGRCSHRLPPRFPHPPSLPPALFPPPSPCIGVSRRSAQVKHELLLNHALVFSACRLHMWLQALQTTFVLATAVTANIWSLQTEPKVAALT